jgi:hypothetical protein
MVANAYSPSYLEGRGRRITVLSEKQIKVKRAGGSDSSGRVKYQP